MGRSVSCPAGAVWKVYATPGLEDSDDFQELVGNLRESLQEKFPSLEWENGWLDREDHVILRNRFALVGISEYCGLVCIWGVVDPYSARPELGHKWLASTAAKFEQVAGAVTGGLLKSLGYASNGEQFFTIQR